MPEPRAVLVSCPYSLVENVTVTECSDGTEVVFLAVWVAAVFFAVRGELVFFAGVTVEVVFVVDDVESLTIALAACFLAEAEGAERLAADFFVAVFFVAVAAEGILNLLGFVVERNELGLPHKESNGALIVFASRTPENEPQVVQVVLEVLIPKGRVVNLKHHAVILPSCISRREARKVNLYGRGVEFRPEVLDEI